MFSITTIASSTTMPVASTIAKSVSVLIEKSSRFTNANAPISDTGIVSAGISVARQLWRKTNITRTTRPTASSSVCTTSLIDSRTTVVVSNATRVLQARRKRPAQTQQLRLDAVADVESIGGRQSDHREAQRVESLKAQRRRVGFGAQLRRADVAQPDERPVLART